MACVELMFLMLHITPLWGGWLSYNHCMQLQSLMQSCIACKTVAPTLKKVWKCIGIIPDGNASLAGTFRSTAANITRDVCESPTRTLIQPQDQIVWFCQTVGQRFTLHHFRSVQGRRISTHVIRILKDTFTLQDSVTWFYTEVGSAV